MTLHKKDSSQDNSFSLDVSCELHLRGMFRVSEVTQAQLDDKEAFKMTKLEGFGFSQFINVGRPIQGGLMGDRVILQAEAAGFSKTRRDGNNTSTTQKTAFAARSLVALYQGDTCVWNVDPLGK